MAETERCALFVEQEDLKNEIAQLERNSESRRAYLVSIGQKLPGIPSPLIINTSDWNIPIIDQR